MSYLEIALKKGKKNISSKNVYLQPFKELDIPNPELELETKIKEKEKKLYVTIKSKYFAKGVWIFSSGENNFSNNFLPPIGRFIISSLVLGPSRRILLPVLYLCLQGALALCE